MATRIDRKEVDRLVLEHLPAVLRLAMRLTRHVHTAEDVAQESLCRVLRRWRTYRGESAFKTWMLQIVVNVDRDRRRRQRDLQPLEDSQALAKSASPFEQLAADELQTNVRAAIDRLPARQREVAILSLGEGLPAREVAHILETTEANVHTCLHLARKRIAREIGVDCAKQDLS